jgi:DNA-binding NtrC family response regulator
MGSILVVDDEEALRDLVCGILGEAGYSVQTAGDGQEALSVYTRYQESIGAVLLDLNLPKMSGRDVLKRIQQVNPHVKVIVTSGYPAECSASDTSGSCANAFLPKPYTVDAVLRAVRNALVDNMDTQFDTGCSATMPSLLGDRCIPYSWGSSSLSARETLPDNASHILLAPPQSATRQDGTEDEPRQRSSLLFG